MAGYGGMPRSKAAIKHKQTTKPTFLLTCEKCKKAYPRSYSRLKRVNQV
jgi:ribosomal protein L44E